MNEEEFENKLRNGELEHIEPEPTQVFKNAIIFKQQAIPDYDKSNNFESGYLLKNHSLKIEPSKIATYNKLREIHWEPVNTYLSDKLLKNYLLKNHLLRPESFINTIEGRYFNKKPINMEFRDIEGDLINIIANGIYRISAAELIIKVRNAIKPRDATKIAQEWAKSTHDNTNGSFEMRIPSIEWELNTIEDLQSLHTMCCALNTCIILINYILEESKPDGKIGEKINYIASQPVGPMDAPNTIFVECFTKKKFRLLQSAELKNIKPAQKPIMEQYNSGILYTHVGLDGREFSYLNYKKLIDALNSFSDDPIEGINTDILETDGGLAKLEIDKEGKILNIKAKINKESTSNVNLIAGLLNGFSDYKDMNSIPTTINNISISMGGTDELFVTDSPTDPILTAAEKMDEPFGNYIQEEELTTQFSKAGKETEVRVDPRRISLRDTRNHPYITMLAIREIMRASILQGYYKDLKCDKCNRKKSALYPVFRNSMKKVNFYCLSCIDEIDKMNASKGIKTKIYKPTLTISHLLNSKKNFAGFLDSIERNIKHIEDNPPFALEPFIAEINAAFSTKIRLAALERQHVKGINQANLNGIQRSDEISILSEQINLDDLNPPYFPVTPEEFRNYLGSQSDAGSLLKIPETPERIADEGFLMGKFPTQRPCCNYKVYRINGNQNVTPIARVRSDRNIKATILWEQKLIIVTEEKVTDNEKYCVVSIFISELGSIDISTMEPIAIIKDCLVTKAELGFDALYILLEKNNENPLCKFPIDINGELSHSYEVIFNHVGAFSISQSGYMYYIKHMKIDGKKKFFFCCYNEDSELELIEITETELVNIATVPDGVFVFHGRSTRKMVCMNVNQSIIQIFDETFDLSSKKLISMWFNNKYNILRVPERSSGDIIMEHILNLESSYNPTSLLFINKEISPIRSHSLIEQEGDGEEINLVGIAASAAEFLPVVAVAEVGQNEYIINETAQCFRPLRSCGFVPAQLHMTYGQAFDNASLHHIGSCIEHLKLPMSVEAFVAFPSFHQWRNLVDTVYGTNFASISGAGIFIGLKITQGIARVVLGYDGFRKEAALNAFNRYSSRLVICTEQLSDVIGTLQDIDFKSEDNPGRMERPKDAEIALFGAGENAMRDDVSEKAIKMIHETGKEELQKRGKDSIDINIVPFVRDWSAVKIGSEEAKGLSFAMPTPVEVAAEKGLLYDHQQGCLAVRHAIALFITFAEHEDIGTKGVMDLTPSGDLVD